MRDQDGQRNHTWCYGKGRDTHMLERTTGCFIIVGTHLFGSVVEGAGSLSHFVE